LSKKLTYLASIRPVESQVAGARYAEVYVINPQPNDANWKASTEAIRKNKSSLMFAPLLYECAEDEEPDYEEPTDPFWGGSHKGKWKRAGQPVSLDERDGVVRVKYSVTQDHAWEDIKAGIAKAVSPACDIHEAHLTKPRGGDGSAMLELNDMDFEHVLLLPPGAGAYADAQVERYWEDNQSYSGFNSAVHAMLNEVSHSHIVDEGATRISPDRDGSRQDPSPQREAKQTNKDGDNQMSSSKPEVDEDPLIELHEDYDLSDEELQAEASTLTSRERGKLRSSQFAYVDKDGKGHLTIQDESHVRAALNAAKNWAFRGRTLSIPRSARASVVRKVCSAAKRFGIKSELCGTKASASASEMEESHMSIEPVPEHEKLLKERDTKIAELNRILTTRDEEVKARDEEIKGLKDKVLAAGRSIRSFEEGLGIKHMEITHADDQREIERIGKELVNTKAEARMLREKLRGFLGKRLATLQVHAGLAKPEEEQTVIESCAQLPIDDLYARIGQAEVFAKRLDELGIHAPETYGAGAAVENYNKRKNGFTVGNLCPGVEN